jgi:hypothetical protein
MEYPKTEISPLLEDVVHDNPTYPFPILTINDELLQMYLHQDEFEYFMMECYKKLNREHPNIFGQVFLTTLEMILDTNSINPHNRSTEDYQFIMDRFITVLESLQVTRIEKNSPDGEMMEAML